MWLYWRKRYSYILNIYSNAAMWVPLMCCWWSDVRNPCFCYYKNVFFVLHLTFVIKRYEQVNDSVEAYFLCVFLYILYIYSNATLWVLPMRCFWWLNACKMQPLFLILITLFFFFFLLSNVT